MREIKFRAWDKRKKEWSCFDEEDDWIFDYDLIQDGKNGWYLLMDGGKHIVLMQFTGLKDKKGKEIFEYDHIDFNGLEYEIVFEHGGWFAKCLTTGPNPDGTESKRPDEWLFDFHKLVDIIGNKYENYEK